MVGWHHRLNGHEFEHALGDGEGQRRLACCSPWVHKAASMTEQLSNWATTFSFLCYQRCPWLIFPLPTHFKSVGEKNHLSIKFLNWIASTYILRFQTHSFHMQLIFFPYIVHTVLSGYTWFDSNNDEYATLRSIIIHWSLSSVFDSNLYCLLPHLKKKNSFPEDRMIPLEIPPLSLSFKSWKVFEHK